MRQRANTPSDTPCLAEPLTLWPPVATAMQNALKVEIKRLCRRAERRAVKEVAKAKEDQEKFLKRTGIPALLPKGGKRPPLPDKHFDPAYCARNANFLAKTIWHKVIEGTYRPKPALSFEVPKLTGGTRLIMAFAIPDAALGNILLRRARDRNLKRLSPFSYAYHPDRDVFDAILALKGFITEERLFAVQIDFEKYFDSIPSSYLQKCIDNCELVSLTPHERFVLKEFLHHQYATKIEYPQKNFDRRVKGTPQGSSVSLLLANLANHELDRALERRAGRFVRFADDVVALCSSYDEAEDIEGTFTEHCRTSGLVINVKKSPGIALIGKTDAELRSFQHFDYLGYRFTKDGLKIPERVREKIVRKLSRLIHIYLIQYPLKYGFNQSRSKRTSPRYDWDLLGLIQEIRGYLYGGLQEEELAAFLKGGKKLRKMRGLMGFYALLDDGETLRWLDAWLVTQVRLAMRKRANLLARKYKHGGISPTGTQLILGRWMNRKAWKGPGCPDPRLPSFVRGWRAARKYYFTFGLEDVEPPRYSYY
jgi:RNA-directed DNA polymerase